MVNDANKWTLAASSYHLSNGIVKVPATKTGGNSPSGPLPAYPNDSMAPPNDWIISQELRPSAGLKLFCFSYAGGGASVFRNWTAGLRPGIAVCGIQLPGRENRLREHTFESIVELVPALAEGIRGALDRPFAFYGHSLGAKIAFETARELRRRGKPQPCHLFVGASHAPNVPWPYPPMHHLGEQAFIDEVQKRYGALPRQILEDAELRLLLIPTLRADIQLVETYRYTPEPPLDCPISAFGGISDGTVARSALAAWQLQTTKSFRLEVMRGDHFFLQLERQPLLRAIEAELMTKPGGVELAFGPEGAEWAMQV